MADMLGMSMRFAVEIDGQDLDHWSKASGLEVTWELVEYRAGDNANERWMYPGIAKYPTIKLERAAEAAASEKVQTWLNNTSFTHEPGSSSAKIELRDANRTKVVKWELRGVMPVKWSINAFDANGKSIAIETLELAHQGFLTETNGGPG